MKVVVISDSHGNIANLKHVMGFAGKIKAGAIIHCGDWADLKSVETVKSFKIPLYSVLGNADIDPKVGEELSEQCKKFDRVFLEFEISGKKIGVINSIKKLPIEPAGVDIIFFGHSQKQQESFRDGTKLINPGALEQEIEFAVYDTDSGGISFIDENGITGSIHL